MGNPTNVANMTYNVGTSTRNGVFPRQNTASSQAYASKLQSYCDSDDEYCDSGTSLSVHQSYIQKYGQAAVDFVVQKAINGCM